MSNLLPKCSPRLGLFAAVGFFLSVIQAHAHLPMPIQSQGTILAVEADRHVLLFKPDSGKKPFRLDWNKDTTFLKQGSQASAGELKTNITVVIVYKNVTFHHPLLKKVAWAESSAR
jgi:hypothetical protein